MTTSDPFVAGLAHFGTVVVVCFFTVVDGGITRERLVLGVDVDTSVVVVLSVDAEPHADIAMRDPSRRSRKRTL